ncbi:hypothetical protein ABZ319_08860 [Nocardia sp. NPDC005978]|uniref:hypothetical protein n=1 Tax=Nocardia sp. NPDC005978 TaxID=3156725 RepID=UPI0033B5C91D
MMLGEPTALDYLRADVSGTREEWDTAQTRSVACRLGYVVARTVVFDQYTDAPVDRLINVVRNLGAEAVIVPSLSHFGGIVPAALVQAVDLITVEPYATYARGSAGQPPDEMGAR